MSLKKIALHAALLLSIFSTSEISAFECPSKTSKEKNTVDAELCARSMRIAIRHIDPNGIGYNQGYTTAEGFFSLYNGWDKWNLFLDTRIHVFNNGQPALNAGVGTRYTTDSRVWGVNAYYDYRKTHRYHYNQVAAGLESLGEVWDFRVNGYAPVGKWTSPYYNLAFAYFQGNRAILRQKYEYALGGVNAEAAAHVDTWKHFPLYFAAGPYYLNGKGASTWGGQARASVVMYDYLKIEGNVSYDHLFKWIGQGQIGLTFSFGERKKVQAKASACPTALALSRRAYQPVDRFEIIPVDTERTYSSAINPTTGNPYFFTFVDNTSSSLGTYESPYAALATAEANSDPYGVIYVFPGDGTTTGMNSGITLQDYQMLWGSAVQQNLNTTVGNIAIPVQSSGGIAPTITNTTNDTVVTIANGNQISGFSLQNVADAYAIANTGEVTNLSILNCTMAGPNALPYAGIGATNLAGTLTVDNCTFNAQYGVSIFNTSTNLTANITNSNFSGGTAGAIYWLYDGPVQGTLLVDNCKVNAGAVGVYVEQVTGSSLNATINNSTITAGTLGVHLIEAGTASQTLTMNENTVFSVNQSVYIVQTDSLFATLTNNTLVSYADSGYTLELDSNSGSTNATLFLADNAIVSQDSTSIYLNQSYGNVSGTFNNNTITAYDGGTGINCTLATTAGSQVLSLNENTITSGYYGLSIAQAGGNFTITGGDNIISASYEGYGISTVINMDAVSHTINLSNGSINGSYYGVYIEQTAGTASGTFNNVNLISGGDDYTFYWEVLGAAVNSELTMTNNKLTGYYPIYVYQDSTAPLNATFTDNTCLSGFLGLYADIASGTNNSITMSGNNFLVAEPVYIDHYGGTLDLTLTNNTFIANGYNGYFYHAESAAISTTQIISGNTIQSIGSDAINFSLTSADTSSNFTVTNNVLYSSSNTSYAFISDQSAGTQVLTLSDNTVANSGGVSLVATGGTATWEVNGNQFSSLSNTPVHATGSGGATVSCMQLNNNAVYPISGGTAYVLNGTGTTHFYLNPPTGNTGNTSIDTTAVTEMTCP